MLFPWGCSYFIHQCGYLKLEILWQQFLPKYVIDTFHEKSHTSIAKSGRDDYVCFDENYDTLLLNPKCKLMPSIELVNNTVPLIMTCR